MRDWTQVITDPHEAAVFNALDDPGWDLRTLEGLERDTGLRADEIQAILGKYAPLIRVSQSDRYGTVYQLKNRKRQTDEPLIDRALDFISMGKRRKIA